MFSSLTIRARLLLLVGVQALVLVAIVATGLFSLNRADESMTQLNTDITDQLAVSGLADVVREELLTLANEMSLGSITWEEAQQRLNEARHDFEQTWLSYQSDLPEAELAFISDLHQPSLDGVGEAFTRLAMLADARDRARLDLFMTNDFQSLVTPYFDTLQARANQQQFTAEQGYVAARATNQQLFYATIGVAAFGLILSLGMSQAVRGTIERPVNRLSATVRELTAGNYQARSGVRGKDEIGQLGQAFDQVLEERLTTLARAERENEQLNDSIIQLLQAVFQLSQRDLTVQVPVTEDVTGPMADALNLLTGETSKVLLKVTRLSDDVARASGKVKEQSDRVIVRAEVELREVNTTAEELRNAAVAMDHIADLAKTCDLAAEKTIHTTEQALGMVSGTVQGINGIRDTIRETEKRIKRLGERSQEVSGIVSIINSIAERTHILALNASMHAASAGEAGRGFAVVANEVQRLAENAREATLQIATLVSNIQAETADTVNTMNDVITRVVEGSRQAESAGEQMKLTQQTTSDLVASVQEIARNSYQQAETTNRLLERAAQIQKSTQETSRELQQQTVQTTNLVQYAQGLVDSVRVFTLPAPEEPEQSETDTADRVDRPAIAAV